MKQETTIRAMTDADWPDVVRIYEEGMATRQATFNTDVPVWTDWDSGHLAVGRLVACGADRVIGWAALTPVSRRHAYRGVAEVSVYVGQGARGEGVGMRLLTALVSESERAGFWMLQASIFPENVASVSLHHRCGFRTVGKRERIAEHFGVWRDTVLLERRSLVVGTT